MSVTLHQIQDFYCEALKNEADDVLVPFLYSLFGVFTSPTSSDEDLRVYWKSGDPLEMNLIDKSLLCLGMLLEYMPPEKNVVCHTVGFIEDAACSWSPCYRRAASAAIAVVVDSKSADDKCLDRLFQFVLAAMLDSHPAVRNAGLCALNQYYLHKKINLKMYAEKLPVPLLHCLRLFCEPLRGASPGEPRLPEYLTALFDCVVLLCGVGGDEIETRTFMAFLSKTVEFLLLIVSTSPDTKLCHCALIAVRKIIAASRKESMFYVHRLDKFVKKFLKDERTLKSQGLLISLLEIFKIFDENLSFEDFKPLVNSCLKIIYAGVKWINDINALNCAHKLLENLKFFMDMETPKAMQRYMFEVESRLEKRVRAEQLENEGDTRSGSSAIGDLSPGLSWWEVPAEGLQRPSPAPAPGQRSTRAGRRKDGTSEEDVDSNEADERAISTDVLRLQTSIPQLPSEKERMNSETRAGESLPWRTPDRTESGEWADLCPRQSEGAEEELRLARKRKSGLEELPENASPEKQQMYICELCNVTCSGPKPLQSHLKGQRHRRRVAAQSLTQTLLPAIARPRRRTRKVRALAGPESTTPSPAHAQVAPPRPPTPTLLDDDTPPPPKVVDVEPWKVQIRSAAGTSRNGEGHVSNAFISANRAPGEKVMVNRN